MRFTSENESTRRGTLEKTARNSSFYVTLSSQLQDEIAHLECMSFKHAMSPKPPFYGVSSIIHLGVASFLTNPKEYPHRRSTVLDPERPKNKLSLPFSGLMVPLPPHGWCCHSRV